MTIGAPKLATYADFYALPEGERVELLDGEIIAMPSPRARHSKTSRALGHYIGGGFDDDDGVGGPGGWWILTEVDIALGHDIVRPDLSGWRRERLPNPDEHLPVRVVPDWICEVLSPSNHRHDRIRKRRIYAPHGLRHYWLVDPEARTLEALALDGETWRDVGSYDDEDTARIPPFETIELPIGRLFLPPPPAPP